MTDPEVIVKLTDYEFTAGEIHAFLDEVSSQDSLAANSLITITHECPEKGYGRGQFTLTASSAYRTKGDDE